MALWEILFALGVLNSLPCTLDVNLSCYKISMLLCHIKKKPAELKI